MERRRRFVRVILPTAEIFEEYKVHTLLLESAQLDLRALAGYAVGLWATLEGDHWHYYSPSNLSVVEMVVSITCQDLLVNMALHNERDKHDVALICMSFLKKIYFEVITTIEAFCLTDEQLRELEILEWIGSDLAISIPMR